MVSKSAPKGTPESTTESAIEKLAVARAISGIFAATFEIRAQQVGFQTDNRQELIRFVHHYRSGAASIQMRISTRSLHIVSEHRRATQNASFEFLTGGPLGSANESYRVQVNWLQEDGQWLIDYIDLLEIVDRSQH